MDTKSKNRRKDFANLPADPLRSLGKIVSIASFGLFVIVLVKYVDGRYHCDLESNAQESLVAQNSDQQQRLERFQSESNRMRAELTQLDEQSITFAELAQVQDQLLALARKHGCTLKKASPRAKGTLDFIPKTHSRQNEPNKETPEEAKAEFELSQAGLALNVSGDLTHILSFMKAIREQPWIASADQLILRREASTGGNMSLELELIFMSLQRKKSGEFGESPAPRA
jgi:hypothetical protein